MVKPSFDITYLKKRCEYRNLFIIIIIILTEYCWGRILSLDKMAYSDDQTTVATQQVFDTLLGNWMGPWSRTN